tara:strand:+ start:278 stop:469 length:192 start_codon:yes stop_codon:yes gene_type:complete
MSNEKLLKRAWNDYLLAGEPRRYHYQDMFKYYNAVFNTNETQPTCPSCIARVVKRTRLWIEKN